MASMITFSNPNHCLQVFSMFSEMRDLDEFCDVKIETSIDEISAHKIVLSACSPYFRDVLQHIDTEEENCVVPDEYNSQIVEAIVNYFYVGRLEFDSNLLPDMLACAHFFQTQEILERLQHHVVRQLTVENCLEYFSKTVEYGMNDLRTKIVRYINWHFIDVASQKEWLELSSSTVNTIISSNVLNIERKKIFTKPFGHGITMIKIRQPDCEKLFRNVRFFNLQPIFIKNRAVPELSKGIEVCKDEIKQAIIYQSSNKKTRQLLDTMLNHRYPSKIIYMFNNTAGKAEKYDPIAEEWVEEMRFINEREVSTNEDKKVAIVVNNELYLVSSLKMEKFNIFDLSWENVGKGVDIKESAICADQDSIFIVGGREQATSVKSFNTLSLTWTQLPDMPEGRRLAGAVAIGDRLYVVGGFIGNQPLATCLRFSARSKKWKFIVKMNKTRFGLSTLVIGNKIFAIGGRNHSSSFKNIETFDLDNDKEEWMMFEHDMMKTRNEFGAVFINDQLWCIGGRGENTMERFDFTKNSWEFIGKLGNVRCGMSCIVYTLF
ncbi:kelch-like protein 2 [Xenia sp. Carnegie-2017]|uniref:kelch-like protein 2 n=1 Tax=Xenia sp. Carnegie-2017 TaxID=2897299 RepID=UPI001F03EF86|nr:kelch-like protein 2 [Xenia sp. Carnegie-2017]